MTIQYLKHIAICFLFLFLSLAVRAQEQSIQEYLEINNEIKNKFVMCAKEDDNGIVWIGTGHGLYAFNGNAYKSYLHSDENSIVVDFISAVLPDSENRVWVGTINGISLIKDGIVVRNPDSSITDVFQIVNFDEGNLLYSTKDGLSLYNKETAESRQVVQNEELSLCSQMLGLKNNIWALADNKVNKIYVFDKEFKQINAITFPSSVSINGIEQYNGRVYVATSDGLRCYTPEGKELALLSCLEQYAKGDNILMLAYDKHSDTLLIGIRNNGIYRLDKGKLHPTYGMETLKDVSTAIGIPTGRTLLLSKDNRWIEPFMYNEANSIVIIPGLLKGELAQDLFEDHYSKDIILVTNRDVYLYDYVNGNISKILDGIAGSGQISNSYISKDGDLWIFYSDKTLAKYTRGKDSYILSGSVKIPSGEGFMWENHKGDLCLIDGSTQMSIAGDMKITYTNLSQPTGGIPFMAKDGNIILYGEEGIFRVNEDDTISKILNIPCMSLYYDKDNGLWINSTEKSKNDKLYIYDLESLSLIKAIDKKGLPTDTGLCILGRDKNDVWVTSREKVIRFYGNNYSASVYDNSSSTATNSFLARKGIILKTESNEDRIIFESGKTISVVNPILSSISKEIPVGIDEVFINGYRRQQLADNLVLSHNENQIAFFYSGRDFDSRNYLSYEYKLEGYDNDWVYGGNNLNATYTKLPAGKYTFLVRASSTDENSETGIARLSFRIKYEPFTSPVAIIIYFLLALLIIGAFLYLYEGRLREKHKLQEVELQKKMNEKFTRDKMDMLTNISHEYLTPLSLIYGPAKDIVNNPDSSPEDKKLAGIIASNATRLMNLTEEMMNLDKVEDDNSHLHIVKVDIKKMLEFISGNFDYLLKQKALNLTIDCSESLSAFCDYEKAVRLLTNLLSNAIKYTPTGGDISLSCQSLGCDEAKSTYGIKPEDYSGNYLCISVKDTGIGIPKEKVEKIFSRFVRLKEEVESGNAPEGFGVGLNYALLLALNHKGVINVKKNDPKGSIFSFVFPMEESAYSSEELSEEKEPDEDIIISPAAESQITKTEIDPHTTVLVVEDNNDVREYIESILSKQYLVKSASNGIEALSLAKEDPVDIIISDIMMPEMDGITLCREIKSSDDTCHIPVVLLTAASSSSTRLSGTEAGAEGYIKKPFDPEELKAVVGNILLNRARLQKALMNSAAPVETQKIDQPEEQEQSETININAKDKVFLETMWKEIEDHISDEEFNAAALAEEMSVSYSKFYYKVKGLLGTTPQDAMLSYKLNKAMDLLKEGSLNVSEVCYKVGFKSLGGFSRSFKNKYGVSPSSIK